MNKLSMVVTGGGGFSGSNIVEKLLNKNVKYIRIIDNLSTGNKKTLIFY